MNRFDIRLPVRLSAVTAGLAAIGLIVAATLSGCGSGQVSQSANQAPAVNGTGGALGHVALRNVHIQAVQTGDFLRPGQAVDLVLVASNQSTDVADSLVGISTGIGKVTVTGDTQLPAGGMLMIGTPAGQTGAAEDVMRDVKTAVATVALTEPITNGLTYEFTFNFKKAGSTTLAVPISAGVAPQPAPSG